MRCALLGGEPRQRQVVQVDEAVQQVAGGVDLDRQPPFGEVDLDLVRALPQAAADFGLVLAQQVVDELLAGVAGDLLGRVHEAQGRGRDDRLLHRHVGVAQGHVQVAVRVPLVAERPPVSRGIRRMWPAVNGILKPSGAVFGSPCTQYVQKLWYFRCSPSVMTGEPVASNRSIVSRIASS